MNLVAQQLVVQYDKATVFDGFDFAVQAGELVGLIGPNGAGKTTLLRVLAGLLEPQAGSVTCDGHPLPDLTPDARARRIAYLAQGGEMHWPMQAKAVVALGRLPYRKTQLQSGVDAVADAMRATGVAALGERPMDTLSGGERMRVLLARALAVEAPLLLADEPVAALDPRHQLTVMALLRRNADSGHGIVVALHDLSLAARFCDRLTLIADGRLVAQGSPADVLTPMHLKSAYGVEMVTGSAQNIPYVLPVSDAPIKETMSQVARSVLLLSVLAAPLFASLPANAFPPTATISPGYDRALAESRRAREAEQPDFPKPAPIRPKMPHKHKR